MRSIPRSGRFILILSAIAVATIAAMTGLLLWQLRGQELRHAKAETVSLSRILAEETARSLQSVDLALDLTLARLQEAEKLGVDIDDFAIHAMLRSRIEGMPQLRSIFLTDANGKIRSSALGHPAPNFAVKDRDYFIALRDKPELDRFVSSPVSNRVDNKRTVFISRRIRNQAGLFVGVIVGSLDIAFIESFYDSIRLDRVGPIALYLDQGALIAQAPGDEPAQQEKVSLPVFTTDGKADDAVQTVRMETGAPGIRTYRKVRGFPMTLSVGISDREALNAWRDTARLILSGAAANILLLIGATVLLFLRIVREEALATVARESSNQLRAMVDSAMDAIVTIDSERRVVVFNPAAQAMFGYSEGDVLGKSIDMLIPARFRAAHSGNIASFRSSGVNARMKDARIDITGLRSDGKEFPLESTIARVTIDGKEMYTAILRDIGDRRRAESELRESHRQLRELASSLQAVREEERTSIARELHDELGQQLLRLRMDLSWLSGRIKELPPSVRDKVDDMKKFVAGTVDTLRRVSTRLRPPLLDELGLAEAARWQLDDFCSRTGISIVSHIVIDNEAFDETTSINMFRILQESLTNVAKHSGADKVEVSLIRSFASLTLEIHDNGHGKDFGPKHELGHGLIGIRERTLLLGGIMEIKTSPGQGFCISICIPLPPESEATGAEV
jgi:PAS domain S-box-containing protein